MQVSNSSTSQISVGPFTYHQMLRVKVLSKPLVGIVQQASSRAKTAKVVAISYVVHPVVPKVRVLHILRPLRCLQSLFAQSEGLIRRRREP